MNINNNMDGLEQKNILLKQKIQELEEYLKKYTICDNFLFGQCNYRGRIDSRLFWDEVLYSEGRHKPFFRGKIHLMALITFIFYLIDHIKLAKDNNLAFLLGCLNLFGNCFCFFTSALYHVFSWSVSTEITLQKLDHMAISLWCHLMMYPVAFLLLPKEYGYTFIFINTIICITNFVIIYYSKPSILIHSLVPGSLVIFLPVCWYYMSQQEWWYCIGVYFFQILGTVVFVIEKTPSFCNKDLFTFHEIFHFLSLGSSLFVYLANKEIIKNYIERCSNGVCQK
jgi:channel protein (hemolysin III family)